MFCSVLNLDVTPDVIDVITNDGVPLKVVDHILIAQTSVHALNIPTPRQIARQEKGRQGWGFVGKAK